MTVLGEIFDRNGEKALSALGSGADKGLGAVSWLMIELDKLRGEGIQFTFPDHLDDREIDLRLFAIFDYLTCSVGRPAYARYRKTFLVGNPNAQWRKIDEWIIRHPQ